MANLMVQENDNGVTFTAKVVPGSSRTAISGLYDEMLKVKVSAAPEKGKANLCLIEFLAKKLGVSKKNVSIISGQTNPVKNVQILGISKESLLEKLGLTNKNYNGDLGDL